MENNMNIGQNGHFPSPLQHNPFFNPPPITQKMPKPLPTKKRATNLFEADLYRLFKSKALLVIMIIFSVLTFLFVMGMVLFRFLLGYELGAGYYELRYVWSVFTEFALMTMLPTMFTLCFVIFIAINTGSEYTFNTIRNKVIAGNSRIKIYISTWLFNITLFLVAYLAYIVILLPFTGLIFSFHGTLNRLARLTMAIPVYISIVSIATFIAMSIKSRAIGILLNVALVYVVPIIVMVVSVFVMLGVDIGSGNYRSYEIFEWIITLNPYNMISEIFAFPIFESLLFGGIDGVMDLIIYGPSVPYLRASIVGVGYTAIFTGFGLLRFTRMDIK
ncbi:MAG: ABC transporter permease [Firmicutes bacterium]|nr:ABC transporter permease [Bacillota bacterium]